MVWDTAEYGYGFAVVSEEGVFVGVELSPSEGGVPGVGFVGRFDAVEGRVPVAVRVVFFATFGPQHVWCKA